MVCVKISAGVSKQLSLFVCLFVCFSGCILSHQSYSGETKRQEYV